MRGSFSAVGSSDFTTSTWTFATNRFKGGVAAVIFVGRHLARKQHAVRRAQSEGSAARRFVRRPKTLAWLGHGLLDGDASFFCAQTDFVLFEVGPSTGLPLRGISRSA
jgi:hypothetical protein